MHSVTDRRPVPRPARKSLHPLVRTLFGMMRSPLCKSSLTSVTNDHEGRHGDPGTAGRPRPGRRGADDLHRPRRDRRTARGQARLFRPDRRRVADPHLGGDEDPRAGDGGRVRRARPGGRRRRRADDAEPLRARPGRPRRGARRRGPHHRVRDARARPGRLRGRPLLGEVRRTGRHRPAGPLAARPGPPARPPQDHRGERQGVPARRPLPQLGRPSPSSAAGSWPPTRSRSTGAGRRSGPRTPSPCSTPPAPPATPRAS